MGWKYVTTSSFCGVFTDKSVEMCGGVCGFVVLYVIFVAEFSRWVLFLGGRFVKKFRMCCCGTGRMFVRSGSGKLIVVVVSDDYFLF